MTLRRSVGAGGIAMLLMLVATAAWAASVTGKWSGPQGTVELKQDGNSVTGHGTLPNGEHVSVVGVMLGNQVHYSYSRTSGGFGVGTMTLSKDGDALDSTFYEHTNGTSGKWHITRGKTAPATEPLQIAGKWNSNMGDAVVEQTGADVAAKVTFVNGHTAQLKGQLEGRTLSFTYELGQGGGGNGKITLSDDGAILSGKYLDQPSGAEGELILVRPGPVPCGLPSPPAAE